MCGSTSAAARLRREAPLLAVKRLPDACGGRGRTAEDQGGAWRTVEEHIEVRGGREV